MKRPLIAVVALCAALSACQSTNGPNPSPTPSERPSWSPVPLWRPSLTPMPNLVPNLVTPDQTHVEGDDGSLGGPTGHYWPNSN